MKEQKPSPPPPLFLLHVGAGCNGVYIIQVWLNLASNCTTALVLANRVIQSLGEFSFLAALLHDQTCHCCSGHVFSQSLAVPGKQPIVNALTLWWLEI